MRRDYTDCDGFLESDGDEFDPRPPQRLIDGASLGALAALELGRSANYARRVPVAKRARNAPKRLGRLDLEDWPVWLGAIVGALVAFWLVHR